MCGIAGVVDLRGRTVDRELLTRMTDTLAHRGPDDTGVWTDGNVGLGHRRLAILDLSPSGHQPMSDQSGRYWIVFNGEIYNFRELRAELVREGNGFRSQSDTEVILALYARDGEACVQSMEGMWAFAIYDTVARCLFCSRDRFGKKPFYYFADGTWFAFASQPKALRSLAGLSWDLDPESLRFYLTFGYIPAPRTAWRDIRKLPHGCSLTIDLGAGAAPHVTRYWSTQEWLRPDATLTGDDMDRGIRSHLDQAVERRLVADVPVGAFLSGGIDSSAVVATMQQVHRSTQRLHTFSLGFEHPRYDETRYAQTIARALGTEHHVERIDAWGALRILEKLPEFFDEPFADSSMIPTYAVSELARKFVTVSLSGDGGDELWGGYHSYILHAYLARIQRLLPRVLHGVTARLGRGVAGLLRPARTNPGLALGLVGLRWLKAPSWERFARLSSLLVEVDRSTYDPFRLEKAPSHWADVLMQTYLRTHLVDDFLVKVDRASMAHALEVRCPFLDTDFVKFALRVPASEKISVGVVRYRMKGALRRALTDRVPAEILGRGKMGFSLPLAGYFVHEWRAVLETRLSRLRKRDLLPLSHAQLDEVLRAHARGTADYAQFLYALLFLELWLEHWSK